jgi:hypothetical protein
MSRVGRRGRADREGRLPGTALLRRSRRQGCRRPGPPIPATVLSHTLFRENVMHTHWSGILGVSLLALLLDSFSMVEAGQRRGSFRSCGYLSSHYWAARPTAPDNSTIFETQSRYPSTENAYPSSPSRFVPARATTIVPSLPPRIVTSLSEQTPNDNFSYSGQ